VYSKGKPELYGAYNVGHLSKPETHGYVNMGVNWQQGGAIVQYDPRDRDWSVQVELYVIDGKVRRV
jgi:hypothetical protein